MIKYGMGITLITFVDKYYEYSGALDVEDKRTYNWRVRIGVKSQLTKRTHTKSSTRRKYNKWVIGG
jgi:hypothetical protein